MQPGAADAHYAVGLAQLRQENERGAFAAFKQCLKLQPAHANALQQVDIFRKRSEGY
jgi:hypothetical protein